MLLGEMDTSAGFNLGYFITELEAPPWGNTQGGWPALSEFSWELEEVIYDG